VDGGGRSGGRGGEIPTSLIIERRGKLGEMFSPQMRFEKHQELKSGAARKGVESMRVAGRTRIEGPEMRKDLRAWRGGGILVCTQSWERKKKKKSCTSHLIQPL